MVVKPLDFVTRSSKGVVQPALKCRGREYLRIIDGPEYTAGGYQAFTASPIFRSGRKVMRTTVSRVLCWFESRSLSPVYSGRLHWLSLEICPKNKFYRVRLSGPLPFWVGKTSDVYSRLITVPETSLC
jgi:hypothetical protein